MPEISRFYGIIISMYYDDHNPPHFHARYGKDKAVIEIASIRLLEGRIPPRVLGLIVEWTVQHQLELMDNWNTMQNDEPPRKIRPLQ